MRRHEDARLDLPAPREAVEDFDLGHLDPDPLTGWVQGPQTPADRVAARRRLDRLADEWWQFRLLYVHERPADSND